MNAGTCFVVQQAPLASGDPPFEMCEHKGIGHPDSICDGAAEAVSSALCRAYLDAYGAVQHYNVDKALLVGGESAPGFGGGRLLTPLRLIVCGRATPLPGVDLAQFVHAAARDYLTANLRCDPACFTIESAVRGGSPNLQRVLAAHSDEIGQGEAEMAVVATDWTKHTDAALLDGSPTALLHPHPGVAEGGPLSTAHSEAVPSRPRSGSWIFRVGRRGRQ